jgi:hypothetical protein
MTNQEIKTIETAVINYLNKMTPEQQLAEATTRIFTHPWGYAYSEEYHIEEGHFSKKALQLSNNELEQLTVDYFSEIMDWAEEDMVNNPEEYGLDAEDIENEEYGFWDEDGVNWLKFSNYIRVLIQGAILEMEDAVEIA